jgi:hypothetical protein
MRFTDDNFPLLEGRYYELEDGRMVGPVRKVDDPMPRKWLRVMVWGDGYYEVPGYHHDEQTAVVNLVAEPEREPIPEPPKPDYTAFLKELSELSLKHGFFIGGCGCCGSPFVDSGSNVSGKYTVSEDGDNMEWKGIET